MAKVVCKYKLYSDFVYWLVFEISFYFVFFIVLEFIVLIMLVLI